MDIAGARMRHPYPEGARMLVTLPPPTRPAPDSPGPSCPRRGRGYSRRPGSRVLLEARPQIEDAAKPGLHAPGLRSFHASPHPHTPTVDCRNGVIGGICSDFGSNSQKLLEAACVIEPPTTENRFGSRLHYV